jgi:hypothetical protein
MKRTMMILAVFAMLIGACNLPTGGNDEIDAIATLGVVTAAAPTQGQPPTLMPVPTLTMAPTQDLPDVSTAPVITVTSESFGATRVLFAKNAVGAVIVGTVTAPDPTRYILYAFAKQHMFVELSSPNDAANFSVAAVSSQTVLKPLDNDSRTWDGILPASDDYLISVALGSATTDFKLTITILWQ